MYFYRSICLIKQSLCTENNDKYANIVRNKSAQIDESLVNNTIELIKQLGIMLVAFDFDQTMITIHAAQWNGSVRNISNSVRPEFAAILPRLIISGINVCVTTFSDKIGLISRSIEHAIGLNK